MTTPSNAVSDVAVDSKGAELSSISPARLIYWSVRRELWENRSIYLAPLIVGIFVLFGTLLSTIRLPDQIRSLSAGSAKAQEAINLPYTAIAGVLVFTAIIVGVFYCLEALQSERRDRSILFWKSLPVSDRITVLSKASIPFVVLPVVVFSLAFLGKSILLMFSTGVVIASGLSVSALWGNVEFFESSFALLYGLAAIVLWHAPIYAWLLLVSGWARRVAFLWALLPLLPIVVVEKVAFNSSHFCSLVQYRLLGWFTLAFDMQAPDRHDQLTFLTAWRFFGTPGLWIGLVVAAVFLALAVRLRRSREPN